MTTLTSVGTVGGRYFIVRPSAMGEPNFGLTKFGNILLQVSPLQVAWVASSQMRKIYRIPAPIAVRRHFCFCRSRKSCPCFSIFFIISLALASSSSSVSASSLVDSALVAAGGADGSGQFASVSFTLT